MIRLRLSLYTFTLVVVFGATYGVGRVWP